MVVFHIAQRIGVTAAHVTHHDHQFLTLSLAKLLDRRGRRLVLTELGESLVRRGEGLLPHVGELEEEVALGKGIGTGEVAIGVDPEAELSLLPGVLKAFVPDHPGTRASSNVTCLSWIGF